MRQKFKHGCEVWDNFTKKEIEMINKLIPNTLKRVLEVPKATPSQAISHEMGVIDLDLEIAMERILLAVQVRKMNSSRIAKQLFDKMYEKGIPGFCTNVSDSLKLLKFDNLMFFDQIQNERKTIKEKLVEIQERRLIEGMMKLSKTDGILENFKFEGRTKEYLLKLPYNESKVIFMLRTRMFPTKANFPGRWGVSKLCTYCCKNETDEHLFQCCGYTDLNTVNCCHSMFMTLECDLEQLSKGARVLVKMYERLVMTNEDCSLNGLNKDVH